MSQTTTPTLPATRGEAELEAQLALMTSAVARCFERMEGEDRTQYGTLRRDECGNAERLLALSSGIGLALAKIKGRFEHEIRVNRTAAADTPHLSGKVRFNWASGPTAKEAPPSATPTG